MRKLDRCDIEGARGFDLGYGSIRDFDKRLRRHQRNDQTCSDAGHVKEDAEVAPHLRHRDEFHARSSLV